MGGKTKDTKGGPGLFSKLRGLFSSKAKEKKLVNEYEEIVQRNPEDHRARVKLGEWYAKQGNLDRATEEFLTVANAYKNDGFNLKAIATYKQILKINAANTTIILELADLYKRQGLIRDAINEYHEAINIFQAEGKKPEVLRILKKMSELSHDSVDLGMRLVEIYSAEGYVKEATEQLILVATVFNEREEKEEAIAIYKRMLGLYPDIPAALQAVRELFEERGSPSKASMVKDLVEEGRSKPSLFKNMDRLAARLRTIDTSDSGFIIEEEAPEGAEEAEVGELDKEIESFIQSYSLKDEGAEAESPIEPFPSIEELPPSAGETEARGVARVREAPGAAGSPATRPSRRAEEPEVEVAVLPEDALEGVEEIEEIEDVGEVEGVEEVEEVEAEEVEEIEEASERPGDPVAPGDASWETSSVQELSEEGDGESWKEEAVEARAEGREDDIGEVEEGGAPAAEDREAEEEGEEEAYEPSEEGGEELVYRVTESADDRVRLKSERDFLEKGYASRDDAAFDPGSHEAFTTAGFERVFEEFRKGLEKQIGEEDAETHYNLGIAYKEMDLHEEAIHEFEVAMRSPQWRADSLTMIGMCFQDIGDFEQSLEYFLEAIQCDGLPRDKVMGLNYEVGLALEELQRFEEAYDYFSKVYSMDENYRNVKKKLADLLKDLKQ